MPGFNPDKINIHDLTVEEPEKELDSRFNPNRDIDEKTWEKIEKAKIGLDDNPINAYETIMGRKPEVNLNFYRNRTENHRYLDSAHFAKCAFMELAVGGKPEINDSDWRRIDKSIKNMSESEFRDPEFQNIINLYAYKKLLGKKVDLPHKDRVDLEKLRERIRKPHKESEHYLWRQFARLSAFGRVLDTEPDTFSTDWEEMREEAESCLKNGRVDEYLETCFYMSILGADDIEIPKGGGLKLIWQQKTDIKQKQSQMPEQRNF